jgi:hypothetical protein
MIVGMILMKMAGLPYYSPTFARGGLAAVFSCQVFQVSGTSPTLDIDVEHKNIEDTSFVSAGTFTQFTAAGVDIKSLGSIKEQVRFKYVVGGTETYAAVHFNMLAPAWRPY